MILTEEFVNKQCSDNARAFFEMATSLGYTILCPEDETGSLKRGFMLQNQYGAIYSYPVGETALDVMGPILRFIIDFDRAGASKAAQPSRIDQLEERIDKIEKLLTDAPAAEVQESGTEETALDRLKKRARNIGNGIIDRANGRLMYCRSRQSNSKTKGLRAVFTDDNILESQKTRWHVNGKWTFEPYELNELKAVIAHDEKLYAEHFGKPD